MNSKVVKYKDFFIIIDEWNLEDDKLKNIKLEEYIAYIIDDRLRFPFLKWYKIFSRFRYQVKDVIKEAKLAIDNYLENRDKYKITLKVRCNKDEYYAMDHLCYAIKNILPIYEGRLEDMVVIDSNDEVFYTDYKKELENGSDRKNL